MIKSIEFVSYKKNKTNKDKDQILKCNSKSVSKKLPQRKSERIAQKIDKGLVKNKRFNRDRFLKKTAKKTKGLIYISETEAKIIPFVGTFSEKVSVENLLAQIGIDSKTLVEEIDFEDFFRHPSKVQDWFDKDRIKIAKKYISLKKLLGENLTDIKVYKLGRINLEIYIVGLDSENNLIGIKTKAIET